MNERPRLLIDLSVPPPGGAGTHALGFAEGIVADPSVDRSDLVVLLDRAWADEHRATVDALVSSGATVDELDLPTPGTWKARLTRGFSTRSAVARHRPDISFFPRDVAPRGVGRYAVLVKNLFAWRTDERTTAVGSPLSAFLLRRAAAGSARRATAVFAVSTPMARAVGDVAAVRAVIHEACSMEEAPTRATPHGGRPRAISVGTINPHKHFDRVVRGVARARATGCDFELKIFGGNQTSDHAQEVESLAERLLGQGVLQGRVDGQDLVDAYRNADVLIVTSTFESFCFPLIEAMRSGCVVVAPRSALVDELCGQYAVTYEEGDDDSLADTLARALVDRDRRAEAAKVHARRYNWPDFVENVLGELRAVVAETR